MGRPRTTGTGKKPKRYTRIAVDYTHKRRLLEFLVAGHSVNEAIAQFYPNCSEADTLRKQKQISKWKKQQDHIIADGWSVSSQMLKYKALEVAADEGLSPETFKASHSWRRRFMRRHKLSIRARTRQGQTTPEDAALAKEKFSSEVRAAIIEHGISNVYNADQTAVFFEYLPRKTVNTRGAKTVWVKCDGKDKERATVMLLGDWHGNKYAPFVIFKCGTSRHKNIQEENDAVRHGFSVRLWKEVFGLQALHDCRIYGNPTAWWNSYISLQFIQYHFGYRDNMDEKLLLLWDDSSGHWTLEVLDYAASINVILMKVPPRYTYVCQPADVAWNQPFKCRLRQRWLDCLRAQIAAHHSREKERAEKRSQLGEQIAVIGRNEMQEVARVEISRVQEQDPSWAFEMVAPKRVDIASWIAESWHDLSATTIVSGFANADLLGDTRKVDAPTEYLGIDNITDLLGELEGLGAVGKQVCSDDEYASSSDDDFF
ncbi:hypothetical protein PR001_g12464 [Phytophthora rubi]|uniref:HTH CENPB-type domain-containing protein n=1 Tax=Phytophthora rubi TaxID=129364 RepID=A0A6A3MA01_9STRA|nr:hypothetical protein PR001_g12464 [Phytophthora rubi]